ncbi:hypothetical protein CIW49_18590 [Mycolicibacterium sp. P1-18]|nr:hypothetical protein CIW49_18590 [Mycolicibacterium sp. P1-18]
MVLVLVVGTHGACFTGSTKTSPLTSVRRFGQNHRRAASAHVAWSVEFAPDESGAKASARG